MTLYELTANFLTLQNMLEDPEMDSEAIVNTMESIDGEIEYKADGYAKVIKNMEANIAAIDKERERLTAKKTLLEAGVKRLKENLQSSMIAIGKTKFKTDLFSFNIQKNGGAEPVIVDVPTEDLPDECVIISEKPDLKALAALLKDPENAKHYAKYAHFGERGESLRIK